MVAPKPGGFLPLRLPDIAVYVNCGFVAGEFARGGLAGRCRLCKLWLFSRAVFKGRI